MEPDDLHPQYSEMVDVWKKCRDASKGQRAIHAGKEKYLKRLSGQTDDEYASYVARALYFNATGRTLEGMSGLVFKKAPVVDFPKAIETWQNDVTLTGKNLINLSREILNETLTTGRFGLLVDYPQLNTDKTITIGEAQSLNLRPYITTYFAEDIINWRMGRVGNQTKMVMVALREINPLDSSKEIIRHLTLENGYYEQVEYIKDKDTKKYIETSRVAPKINGKIIDFIPFWFVGAEDKNGDCCDPPLEDLVYINISHYQNSADLENGAHISGLPTPYVTGIDPYELSVDQKTKQRVLNLGSGAAWILPNAECKAGFIQVGSDGFATIEKLMDRKEQQMAVLGARMIAPDKKGVESSETASIRRAGETSVLSGIASAIEIPFVQALNFMAKWYSVETEIKFAYNKDYLVFPLSAQELTALVQAWQSGAISEKALFDALKAGEVYSDSTTYEEEKADKDLEGPPLGGINDNSQSTNT